MDSSERSHDPSPRRAPLGPSQSGGHCCTTNAIEEVVLTGRSRDPIEALFERSASTGTLAPY